MFEKLSPTCNGRNTATIVEEVKSNKHKKEEKIGFFGRVLNRMCLSYQGQKGVTAISNRSFSLIRFLSLTSLLISVRGQGSNPFPSKILLASLDGSTGFTLAGNSAGVQAGSTVSSIGDMNGDGLSDLLVGASNANPSGKSYAGETYLHFGRKGLGSNGVIYLSNLNGTNGIIIQGESAGDSSGSSVSYAGDVNGDGLSDVIIGSVNAAPQGRSKAGKSYVIFGSRKLDKIPILQLSALDGNNGFVVDGENPGDANGNAVSSAGDFNGDGIDDLLIAANNADSFVRSNVGQVYVIYGGRTLGLSGTVSLSDLNGTNGFVIIGEETDDRIGYSISYAGDVNGDGFSDILVGAPFADPSGKSNAGKVYVVFGGLQLRSGGLLSLTSLNGTQGFVIQGEQPYDQCGAAVANAGDVNGDGFSDILVGAPQSAPSGRMNAGKTYLVFGGRMISKGGNLDLSSLDGKNGYSLNGEVQSLSGSSVSTAGDFNSDGIDDFMIGAPLAIASGRIGVGKTYMIFGGKNLSLNRSLELTSLNSTQGFVLIGDQLDARAGSSLSPAKDLNGDGIVDIVLGAPLGSYKRPKSGRVYVVYGRNASTTKLTTSNRRSRQPLLSSSGSKTVSPEQIQTSAFNSLLQTLGSTSSSPVSQEKAVSQVIINTSPQQSLFPASSSIGSFDQTLLLGPSIGGGVLGLGCSLLAICLFLSRKKSTQEETSENKPKPKFSISEASSIDDGGDDTVDSTHYQQIELRPPSTHYQQIAAPPPGTHYEEFNP